MAGRRVVVTGGAGFCGAHVAAAFAAAGWQVTNAARRPGPTGQWVPWDAVTDALPAAGADLVVHCAAVVSDSADPATAQAVNVVATQRILELGVPVVHLSSSSVYGTSPAPGPVGEDAALGRGGLLGAYARTKARADELAVAAGAWVLRPRAVYGPGDRVLLPRLLRQVRRGVLVLPGADVRTSMTDVRELARACVEAVDWPSGAYNVADPVPVLRDETARAAVLAATGLAVRIVHVPAGIARGVARTVERRPAPSLTPYAVNEAGRGMVLDLGKARRAGWTGTGDIRAYLGTLSSR